MLSPSSGAGDDDRCPNPPKKRDAKFDPARRGAADGEPGHRRRRHRRAREAGAARGRCQKIAGAVSVFGRVADFSLAVGFGATAAVGAEG